METNQTIAQHIHLAFFSGQHNPLDHPEGGGDSYIIGASPLEPITTSNNGIAMSRVYVPLDGYVRWFSFQTRVRGTLGSSEAGSLHLIIQNAAGRDTFYQLSDALTWDSVFGVVDGDIQLEQAELSVSKGDWLEFNPRAPETWATRPTDVSYYGQILIAP